MSSMNKYERLSHTRKQLQDAGLAPDWLTTSGYQLLTNQNYLDRGETPKDMYARIAKRAAELTNFQIPADYNYLTWYDAFFDIMWKGWLSPATPVLTNMGNNRGHPISCSGTHLGDSIRSFGLARLEIEQLTQRGYGTSWGLDLVRHMGAPISKGGTASGIMHPASDVVNSMKKVTQGDSRRGNIGQYLNPLHPDFDELADQLKSDHTGWNVGWNFTEEFHELLKKDPDRADHIWKRILHLKMITGKGYMLFLDKVNANVPKMYRDKGFKVRHSNLCAEIALMNDPDHSFTCVLSSMNVVKFDEWKDTKAVEIATIFLDAVTSDMLIKAKQEEGFEKVIAFTEKSRALGLGQLGISSYSQLQSWEYGSLLDIMFNQQLTKLLVDRSRAASELMAIEVGEPEWMQGYGRRNSHLLAFPPTKSTAIVMGGYSEGINPVYANVYEQETAGGIVYRINPVLLPIMKERGQYTKEVMERISKAQGSVQGEDWLSDHEKLVFRTAYEINQETILLKGSHRQKIMNSGPDSIGQGQSLNIYITAEETEEEISRLHKIALNDPYLQSMYYVHSLNEDSTYKVDKSECLSCNG